MKEQSNLMLDVSQAHELKMAFRRTGWTNAEIKTLSEKDFLSDVLKVIRGQSEINYKEYKIPCNTTPFIPDGLCIVEHRKFNFFNLNSNYTKLDLSRKLKNMCNSGANIKKHLSKKFVMNANILDFLIINPKMIPENWKNKLIYFWGTIYGTSDGGLYVSCLDARKSDLKRVFYPIKRI